jgi:hypothetical protein
MTEFQPKPSAPKPGSLGKRGDLRSLILTLIFTCISLPSQGQKPTENPMGYSRLTEGVKVTFDQLDRQHLGRQCTVYAKPGFSKAMGGGPPPEPQFQTDPRTKQSFWNGELYAICSEGILLRWYRDAARTSCTETSVASTGIDYIIFKPLPAGGP